MQIKELILKTEFLPGDIVAYRSNPTVPLIVDGLYINDCNLESFEVSPYNYELCDKEGTIYHYRGRDLILIESVKAES